MPYLFTVTGIEMFYGVFGEAPYAKPVVFLHISHSVLEFASKVIHEHGLPQTLELMNLMCA